MREIEPLDLRETMREGQLVPDPDLTFAHHSFGGTFIVTPKDTPRDQGGRQ
jgi:hypothetical protein